MEEFPEYEEEEEEEIEEFSPEVARHELIEYLLRRYGSLQAKDIARVLSCRVRVVQQSLKELESFGRVRRTKLGRSYIWHPAVEASTGFMYL